jgi:hypothetical protein
LVRFYLLKGSERRHWLVVAFHRLVADCSSIEQALRELWLLYGAWVENRSSLLAPNPPQYGDYALWQEKTHPEWLSKHATYWQQRLTGAAPVRWPVDRIDTKVARASLGRMSCRFSEPLSRELRELARRARTLAAAGMLTVYVAVLWRWCRQKDFVVPVKIAGRQSEHKAIVGYFTHIVYLRLELTGEETWTELLSRVSSEFFKALAHEDFGQMALERPELLTGSFFQWITRSPELSGVPEATASGLTVQHVSSRDVGEGLTAIPPGMVDVELTCFDAPEGLYASGVYRADRFAPKTMERFMEELRSTAEEFVLSPGAGIERVARETTAA